MIFGLSRGTHKLKMADRPSELSVVDSSQKNCDKAYKSVVTNESETCANSHTATVNGDGLTNSVDSYGDHIFEDSDLRFRLNKHEETNDSSKYLPRLVFLDSEETLAENNQNDQTGEESVRQERAVSDSAVIQRLASPSLNTFQRSESSGNHFYKNRRSRVSQASIQSSDSELLLDHSVTENSDLPGDEDFERFIMEYPTEHPRLKTWHCHAIGTKIPEDNVARNQLIAVSILSFLFMIGESVGRYT